MLRDSRSYPALSHLSCFPGSFSNCIACSCPSTNYNTSSWTLRNKAPPNLSPLSLTRSQGIDLVYRYTHALVPTPTKSLSLRISSKAQRLSGGGLRGGRCRQSEKAPSQRSGSALLRRLLLSRRAGRRRVMSGTVMVCTFMGGMFALTRIFTH